MMGSAPGLAASTSSACRTRKLEEGATIDVTGSSDAKAARGLRLVGRDARRMTWGGLPKHRFDSVRYTDRPGPIPP